MDGKSVEEVRAKYFYLDGNIFHQPGYGRQPLSEGPVGSVDKKGYLALHFFGRTRKVHRVIFFMMNGYLPKQVDHWDGNKLNNLISNLREATNAENSANRGKMKHAPTPYKGISLCPKTCKWRSSVSKDGKRYAGGYFINQEDAARDYDRLARLHHKSFANLNFPGDEK